MDRMEQVASRVANSCLLAAGKVKPGDKMEYKHKSGEPRALIRPGVIEITKVTGDKVEYDKADGGTGSLPRDLFDKLVDHGSIKKASMGRTAYMGDGVSRTADVVTDFIRKLNQGNYEWVALFKGRKSPGKRPSKELKNMVRGDEEMMRRVIVDPIKVVQERDYLWISFIGTGGRADTYFFSHEPYSALFADQGAAAPKKQVW